LLADHRCRGINFQTYSKRIKLSLAVIAGKKRESLNLKGKVKAQAVPAGDTNLEKGGRTITPMKRAGARRAAVIRYGLRERGQ